MFVVQRLVGLLGARQHAQHEVFHGALLADQPDRELCDLLLVCFRGRRGEGVFQERQRLRPALRDRRE